VSRSVRVWDLPTRIVHWSLAALVLLLWWTSRNDDIALHKLLGFALLALLAFRLWWGFFGSETARFSDFLKGPRAIGAYLRTGATATRGHNPLGALSVVILLALLLTESGLGLFAIDEDGLEAGPLSSYVSFDTAQLAAHYHALVFDVLVGFTALHIIAVLVYFALGQNLIAAMISGRKNVVFPIAEPQRAPLWSLLIGLALASTLFVLLWCFDR
jgi:cytochrome b